MVNPVAAACQQRAHILGNSARFKIRTGLGQYFLYLPGTGTVADAQVANSKALAQSNHTLSQFGQRHDSLIEHLAVGTQYRYAAFISPRING